MNFCSQCGSAQLEKIIPTGDDRIRIVCSNCQSIHYSNPIVVVGCIPTIEDKVLLCRRAIQPRYGKWTVPCGFMENGESVENGAMRETWEESRAKVELLNIQLVYSVVHVNQVYIVFRSKLNPVKYEAGPESLEVQLFDLSAIPWNELAFTSVEYALKTYSEDFQKGQFTTHWHSYRRSDHQTRPTDSS